MYDQNSSPVLVDVSRVPPAPRPVRRRAGLAPYFGPARLAALVMIAVAAGTLTLYVISLSSEDPIAAIPQFATTAIAIAFVAGLLAWRLFLLPSRYRQLLRDGEAAVGRIIDRTARIIEDRHRSYGLYSQGDDPYHDQPTIYTLRYAFHVPEGGIREATMRVGLGDYEQVRCGDDVLIFYDPRRPRRSMIYAFEDDVIIGFEPNDEAIERAA